MFGLGNWAAFFVIGGVEVGEDVIEAATREIKKKGYQHIKFVRKVGGETHASFTHTTKRSTAILFPKRIILN